jgi:23S rRNA (guanosine2251-2'-O)-methyltransferase
MIIFGLHAVAEAVRAGRVREIRVAGRDDDRVRRVLAEAAARGIAVTSVDRAALDRAARHGVHQGIVADVEPPPALSVDLLVASASGAPLIVVLDGVEDPHNVGAIIRTVDAAGATGLIRQERRAAPLTGAAAKAAAGAMPHVAIADVVNIARAVEALQKAGVWTVALDAAAENAYYDLDLTLPVAIVLGSEGHGLRRLVRERCDMTAAIPMAGHVGSVNVSAAAAIVLFEAVRQRRRQQPAGTRPRVRGV